MKLRARQWDQNKLDIPIVISQPNELDISNEKTDAIYLLSEEMKSAGLKEDYTNSSNEDQ